MSWRAQVGDKLIDARSAVGVVKSGDFVVVAPFTCTPQALCQALYERRQEIEDVRVFHPVALFPWFQDDPGGLSLLTFFATEADRAHVNAGDVEYFPITSWRADSLPLAFPREPDVFLVAVSPPDKHGYCSFGPGVWFSPTYVEQARHVIAEVREDFVRTGGTNFVHVSSLDAVVESGPAPKKVGLPTRREDDIAAVEVICTLVANELIRDRDTIQIGVGTVSAALGLYLRERQDLGVHTEIITGGIADLVRDGVINGRYKTMHLGKVVGSSLAAIDRAERALINNNPIFELYEFNYVNDIRVILQHENMVAVNNALMVDLTGQIASESVGSRVWAGAGGQASFAIGATYSPGGRSIIVLPSMAPTAGGAQSRIVSALPLGTSVTVPRDYVDYVVTEYGIASLRDKSYRDRIGELIAIAHPDARPQLEREAAETYGFRRRPNSLNKEGLGENCS